jgi:hypothetical protein
LDEENQGKLGDDWWGICSHKIANLAPILVLLFPFPFDTFLSCVCGWRSAFRNLPDASFPSLIISSSSSVMPEAVGYHQRLARKQGRHCVPEAELGKVVMGTSLHSQKGVRD